MGDESGRGLDARAGADQALREFAVRLETLRIDCGAPSLRQLADRGPGTSVSNLSEIFNGRRLPSIDVTLGLVRAMLASAADSAHDLPHGQETQREVVAMWRKRWQEAKTLQVAADKDARQARAAASRTAEDIITDARARAAQILSTAEEAGRGLIAEAKAEVRKLITDGVAQAEALACDLRKNKDDAAARALALAQQTADQAIAEAWEKANKIVGDARQQAAVIRSEIQQGPEQQAVVTAQEPGKQPQQPTEGSEVWPFDLYDYASSAPYEAAPYSAEHRGHDTPYPRYGDAPVSAGPIKGTNVNMPALGESVTEGTITRWLKKEGETVDLDEPLLEISTDKVDTEIPAPAAGVIVAIYVDEDETVAVGASLALIGPPGTAPAALARPGPRLF